MAAAIWSCPRSSVKDFPALRFLRFFANHGLLTTKDHPQWYTVEGGSQSYLQRMLADLGPSAVSHTPVKRIDRYPNSVHLYAGSRWQAFDEVVLACHSDQSLALLNNPTGTEIRALRSIPYQANRVLLHTDENLMPQRKSVWSSWNFSGTSEVMNTEANVSVTYWMNSLQRLDTDRNYFVSLNPVTEPRHECIVQEFSYDHPVFGNESIQGQRLINAVQGRYRTWYCGAWLGYGFHEDGLKSGMHVARQLGANIPWDRSEQLKPAARPEMLDRHAA